MTATATPAAPPVTAPPRTPSLPPGPSAPRAFQTLRWGFRPMRFLHDCRERYGDIFTVRIAQEGTWVMLADPDYVKQVFTGDPRVFHAGEGNEILLPLVGDNSVLLLDDDAHMQQRKLLLPPFHGKRMTRYGDLMREVALAEIERWPRGTPFPLQPRMQALTLEVIIRAVLGVEDTRRLELLRDTLSQMLREVMDPRVALFIAFLGPRRFRHLPLVDKALGPTNELIYEEIARRRGQPGLDGRDDILSLLLQATHEDGSPMTDRELRDELVTLLVAGHETTATSLAWTLERITRHPEVLARLEEDPDGEYLDAVIKESLRLRPVVPAVARKLAEPVALGGYDLPEGVFIVPSIYLTHRRPDIYPDPLAFKPERFIENPPSNFEYLPFGGGVRRCLGASFAQFEMKIVLGTILRHARVRAPRSRAESVTRRSITFAPSAGGRIVASPA